MAATRRRVDKRDKKIESWLEQNGVPFTFHEEPLALDELDLERSLHNQARYKDIDQTVVERYAEAMENGDQFPPIVVNRRTAKAKLINADGNHRTQAAAHNKYEAWDYGYYEIAVDGKTFALLAMQANTKHGLPTDVDERVRHAIYLIDNGATKDQAAAALAIPVREVEKRLHRVKQERRAQEAGVSMSMWEKIAAGNRSRLATIFTNEGLLAAAELVYKANLNTSEVQELVSMVQASRSGAQQRKIVKDHEEIYAERIQATGGGVLSSQVGKRATSPRARFAQAMSFLGGVQDLTAIVESFGAEERVEAAERARHEGERLIQLSEKLTAGV